MRPARVVAALVAPFCVAIGCVPQSHLAAESCDGGACEDAAADGGDACVGEECSCRDGMVRCDGGCVDTLVDPRNCGACGVACAAGYGCNAGTCGRCGDGVVDGSEECDGDVPSGVSCESQPGTGPAKSGAVACRACKLDYSACAYCHVGETACAGECVDTGSDPRNCGACGRACATVGGMTDLANVLLDGTCAAGRCTRCSMTVLPAGGIFLQSGYGDNLDTTPADASFRLVCSNMEPDAPLTTSFHGKAQAHGEATTGKLVYFALRIGRSDDTATVTAGEFQYIAPGPGAVDIEGPDKTGPDGTVDRYLYSLGCRTAPPMIGCNFGLTIAQGSVLAIEAK